MKLFDKNHDAYIIIEHDTDEAVRLAAIDLQRNLCQLSGKTEGFNIVNGDHQCGIFIKTVENGAHEAYTVNVDENKVTIVGSDILGTVFGIYVFATHCLGIVPVYRLIDVFPEPRDAMELEPQTVVSKPRPSRFRGWFLNDEDLLTDFRGGGGKRDIDYKFYDNVIRPDVLDMILETALRLEINLIIPSSFVDIDNPPEKALADAVVQRGMYITHHHTEPVGVSFFTAENYLKKRGFEEESVSFLTNRPRMEEIWRYYVEKWAHYGKHVVWQLGLRGKADRAVWQHDPNVPDSTARRGAIISDAIATQHRIICETLGHSDFYSTATLWMEGAELYGKGHIKVPKNTVVIFSDIGFSQMFGDDFFTTARKAEDLYGVYYHVGYMQEGPHLAEGCDLRKMTEVYRHALERNSLFYSILNVSNVRPLHFSAWVQAELANDPDCADTDGIVARLTEAIWGEWGKEIQPCIDEYYRAFADMGAEELKKRCRKWNFYYHEYGKLPFPLFSATDGALRYTGRYVLLGNENGWDDDSGYRQELEASLGRWECLYERLTQIESRLPTERRLYFQQFLLFETFYMMQMTRWRLAVGVMTRSRSVAETGEAKETAVSALRSILEKRTVLELGDWKSWHDGERKIDVSDLLEQTEKRYDELTKETV